MTTLRVATYNLYLGADLTLIFGAQDPEHLTGQARLVQQQLHATDFPARAEAMARSLVRERVDVLGLQEVARWSRAAPGPDGGPSEPTVWCDFLVEILGALEQAGAAYDVHAVNDNFSGSASISAAEAMSVLGSNVILVRRGSGVEVTGEATGTYARTLDIATGMDDLVLNVPRSWGCIEARVGGAEFRFANTHTEAYDAGSRNAQRDELLAELASPAGPGKPLVLVGDFNATPDTVGMPPAYVDAWLAGGGDPGGGHTCGQAPDLTNPQSLLQERIDYVWVRDARVLSCKVVGVLEDERTTEANLWQSDHGCVVATVEL